MRLVHLTDPHLSTLEETSFGQLQGKRKLGYLSWTRRRRHLHRRDVLARVVAAVAVAAPDVIALTGDLVQLGLAHEIQQARAWLDELATIAPVVLVPGNHDIYQQDALARVRECWSPYLDFAEEVSGTAAEAGFPTVRRFGEVEFIGISSASPQPFWSAGGAVGHAQFARLEQHLAESAGSFRCVLIHHPPLVGHCARRKALRDADELTRRLSAARVELVLHGHIHRNRATVHADHMRVFATASASNAADYALASYRTFEIDRQAAGWAVAATLSTVSDSHDGLDVVEQSNWLVPAVGP